MIKKIAYRIIKGLIVRSAYAEILACVSMSTVVALRRIAARGVTVNSVLDVGASNGSWSLETRRFWPSARFHLIEANSYHERALRSLCDDSPNFSYVLAVASDTRGSVFFDSSNPFGGLAMKDDVGKGQLLPAVTLDDEVRERGLVGPYLVKLDVHGFEVPILNGANKVLAEASLIVIETYNFQIEPDSLKFFQLCQFMDDLGFGVVDVSEPLWRVKDKAFWQMDLFFIRKDSPEFCYNQYR